MKKVIVLCDVDGVIKISGDGPYKNSDVKDQILRNEMGGVQSLAFFSPSIINSLNSVMLRVSFKMLTSWNEKISLLSQIGLNASDFLQVDTTNYITERQSKLDHIFALAKTHTVIWIDDFALDWINESNTAVPDNIFVIQPDYEQGITEVDLNRLEQLISKFQ